MTGSRSEIRRDCVQRPFDAAARVIELEAEAEELKKRPDYIEMAKKIRYFKDRVEELEGVNSYGRACIVNDRLRTNLAEAVQLFEVIGFSPEHDPQQCDCGDPTGETQGCAACVVANWIASWVGNLI